MVNGQVAFGVENVGFAGQVESVVKDETHEFDGQRSIDSAITGDVDSSLPRVRG